MDLRPNAWRTILLPWLAVLGIFLLAGFGCGLGCFGSDPFAFLRGETLIANFGAFAA